VTRLGGIEAGGTRWTCAIGDAEGEIEDLEEFPTMTPDETIGRAVAFFEQRGGVDGLGVGAFGPVDLDRTSPTWGRVTTTPKPGWADVDVGPALAAALEVPLGLDTDVGAAGIGEFAWGAGRDLELFCYVTVGTGIGAAVLTDGRPLHGLMHPEFGHMRVPRDRRRDPFAGACPFHGDCLEGLASGAALRARWGIRPEDERDEEAWRLEADYLAIGLLNLAYAVSPQRLIVGGGVASRPGLLELVRDAVRELAGGYAGVPATADGIESFIVAPGLDARSGVRGALLLAAEAAGVINQQKEPA
jgi:fructokinase